MEFTLSSYLKFLPAVYRTAFEDLSFQMQQFILSQPEELRELAFCAKGHTEVEDGEEVFALGVGELMLTTKPFANEIPLIYIGAHSQSRMSDSRQSLGFVFTDRGVYIQDQVKAIFAIEPPRYAAYQDYSVADLANFLVSTFDWSFLQPITEQIGMERIEQLLVDTVNFINQALQTTVSYQTIPSTSAEQKTLPERVRELGLTSVIEFADNPVHKKICAKINKKFELQSDETLQWFVTDTVLIFGSVFGMAVTDKAVYSKDLMESPVRTPIAEIDLNQIELDTEGDGIFFNGDIKHVIPGHLDDAQKNALIRLLKQYLR